MLFSDFLEQKNVKEKKKTPLPVFLLVCVGMLWFSVSSQEVQAQGKYATLSAKVSFNPASTNATALLEALQKQTGYVFTFEKSDLQKINLQELHFQNVTLGDVLHYLETETGLIFYVSNKNIAVSRNAAFKKTVAPVQKKDPGKITGKIIDEENGHALPDVSIRVGNKGTSSAIDGSFNLTLPKGKYEAEISSVGYDKKVVTDIEVKENETFSLNVTLKREKSQLAGVVVRASAKKESTSALYIAQKNRASISDGISAEQIARTSDKNIGEVLKRVSGIATMGNKYMVVRGLSERYNSASVNGQIMPSTELNRKNFSFDIIPANMVDQVVVYKTITPDQHAEFGGGNVNVETKAIPSENFMTITAGISVNDQTTGKTFLSQELSSREYFGLPSKSRYLLGKLNWTNTQEIMAQTEWNGLVNKLKDPSQVTNNWMPYERKAHPSQNYQLSFGRVIALKGDRQLGFMASLSYRNTLQTQRVAMDRNGFKDKAEFPVIDNDHRYGFTTNTGGLLGVGFSSQKHKLSFQTMYLGLLDQQLIIGTGFDVDRDHKAMSYNDLTTYTRLLQNQLKGEHAIGRRGVHLKWLGSYSLLDRQRPDNHQTDAFYYPEGVFPSNEFTISTAISRGISAGALRWWSRAYEKTVSWDVQVAAPFQFMLGKTTVKNIMKAGYAGWIKDRLFYVLNTGSGTGHQLPLPMKDYFSPQDTTFSFTISRFSDDFHKTASLHAGYLMLDTRIADKLRLVWGVRGEFYDMNKVNQALEKLEIAINRDRGQEQGYYDLSQLKNRERNLNFFPSANLTYSLTSKMSLRLAYSRSIIRPDLREMAYMKEYDYELGGIFESNVVRSSLLDNYDLRYEWYPGSGEVISASIFSKKIHYPMEIVEFDGVNKQYQLKNNKEATNQGFEIEVRKSLAFTRTPVLKNITLYGNFTYLAAHLIPMDINLNTLSPTDPRVIIYNESTGPKQKRPQTGASNYMYNAGVYYDNKMVSLSMIYNHVSHRIFSTANIYSASLFEQPLNSLDAQIAFRLPKQRIEIRLNVSNLLNNYSLIYSNRYDDGNGGTSLYPMGDKHRDPTQKEMAYDASTDVINYKASPGRTYGMTITYKL